MARAAAAAIHCVLVICRPVLFLFSAMVVSPRFSVFPSIDTKTGVGFMDFFSFSIAVLIAVAWSSSALGLEEEDSSSPSNLSMLVGSGREEVIGMGLMLEAAGIHRRCIVFTEEETIGEKALVPEPAARKATAEAVNICPLPGAEGIVFRFIFVGLYVCAVVCCCYSNPLGVSWW